jgi:hypothetical protein
VVLNTNKERLKRDIKKIVLSQTQIGKNLNSGAKFAYVWLIKI